SAGQRKCSPICETIQHAPAARVSGNGRIIVFLIEIKTGLLSVQKIDFELYAFDFDLDLRWRISAQNVRVQFQPFCLANRRIISLDDGGVSKKIDNRVSDQIFSHVHRQSERLHHEMIAVPVNDQSGQSIAFAPNNSAKPGIDASPNTVFCRLRDASLEEVQVQFLFSTRETARHD